MISKRTWRIFLITLVIALPIRLYQALFLLEPETGFYSDGFLSTGALLIVLMAGCALLCAETAREKQMVPRLPVRSLGAAVAGMFTGFLFFGQSIYSLLGSPAVDNAGMNRILAAAGILAGAAFLWQSYGLAMGDNPWARHPLPALLPPLWGCVCLVALFLSYSGTVNTADNVYDTFSVVFLLLFFFAYAKLHAGIEPARSGRAAVRYGLLSVWLAAITVVPEIVLAVMGTPVLTGYPFGMFLMNGAAACFALLFVFGMHKAGAEPELPAEGETPESDPAQAEETSGGEDDDARLAEELRKAYNSRESFVENGAGAASPEKASEEKPGGEENQR